MSRKRGSRSAGVDHHVTLTVAHEDDTLKRIQILMDAMLRVIQGSQLKRVLSADFVEGCIELMLEGSPKCKGIDATVTVVIEPMNGPKGTAT